MSDGVSGGGSEGVSFDFDLDPALWLVGPTPERPAPRWLPGAVEVLAESFGLDADDQRREAVQAILSVTVRKHPSPLPWFVLLWEDFERVPVVVFYGLVDRALDDDVAGAWLTERAEAAVEAPLVEDVAVAEADSCRRSIIYQNHGGDSVTIDVRWALDTGHPDAVVLAHCASTVGAEVFRAIEPFEDVLRSVRLAPAAAR